MATIRRNEPCPCASGLKYKKCHGSYANPAARANASADARTRELFERHGAAERIREQQQGLGRPIIGFKTNNGHRMVAVGSTLYWSERWKAFPDFLADYLKQKFGSDWGDAEIAKPFAERHPILQWYDAYCRYQHATVKVPGNIATTIVTGIVACYLGLAYSLYLLDHNVEIQERLIRRLKDRENFHGAFYELFVANTLIRAGFQLMLEDETDGLSKHCEFAAISKRTGKKYWVEAKMRAVAGVLGQTQGTNPSPISRLIPHLNDALAKPASDERLIFIDLNAEPEFRPDLKPAWHDRAVHRLERYEINELKAGVTAYVFVTNIAFHRRLDDAPAIAAAPFGLGLPDYNRLGTYRVSEVYRRKQKHIDAHHIGTALLEYAKFPATFDGSLPSETFDCPSSRVQIGETYDFYDLGEHGLIGTVTSASVLESEKAAYIVVSDANGTSQILRKPMSEAELSDYKAHPDAYFGKILPVSKGINDRYELFEWLMEANKGLPRAVLLERLSGGGNVGALKDKSDAELLSDYCEAMVAATPDPNQ
jgi:hypothetical protein